MKGACTHAAGEKAYPAPLSLELGAESQPMTGQRVLVVSACSKRKLGDREADPRSDSLVPARERYAGRAHRRVREAIDRWRGSRIQDHIEWSIVSAGVGLVGEAALVPLYEESFARVSPAAARRRGLNLGLPSGLRHRLKGFDAALFVLPLAYLHAAGAPFEFPTTQLYFASPKVGQEFSRAVVVPCGIGAARELGVSPRDVGAARFASFVDDVVAHGFNSAVRLWGEHWEGQGT